MSRADRWRATCLDASRIIDVEASPEDIEWVGNVAEATLAVGGSFVIICRVYPGAGPWLSFVAAMLVMAFVFLLATAGPSEF